MSEEGDGKKPTIPLTTVSDIVSRTVDGKVKVSKSFMKLVRLLDNRVICIDTGVRKRVYWPIGYRISGSGGEGQCEVD